MSRYISEALDLNTYGAWLKGKKIIINAPTGTGKTTFILREFLPYCQSRGKRMLILCNRRLLKLQYGFDLSEQYERYAELEADVDVMTYQALAEKLTDYSHLKGILKAYDVIVCDEVHFFYADSDFNGFGTYVLLQALIQACFFKTMVMVTATLEEVCPLLVKTFKDCEAKMLREGGEFPGFHEYCWDNRIFDFGEYCDYQRFKGIFVEDEETLVKEVMQSGEKAIIFMDDKSKAEQLKKMFLKIGKLDSQEVYILTAEILETHPNDTVVKALAIAHRVLPRILITTSVLDNGVSIHDSEVRNVVIATESKVSFLQMLGRIRAEHVDECNLYVFPRLTDYYEKRIQQYEEKMQIFDDLSEKNLNLQAIELMQKAWYGDNEKAAFLRKALILTKESLEYYAAKYKWINLKRGDGVLVVNAFAKEKIGNMLLAEKRFYKCSMQGAEQVAVEQIKWIGKTEDELLVISSSYKEERREAFKAELLLVQNFTLEELSDKKAALAKEYRTDILANIVAKNGSFSREKLEAVCHEFGLVLEIQRGDDKKNRYTIREEK